MNAKKFSILTIVSIFFLGLFGCGGGGGRRSTFGGEQCTEDYILPALVVAKVSAEKVKLETKSKSNKKAIASGFYKVKDVSFLYDQRTRDKYGNEFDVVKVSVLETRDKKDRPKFSTPCLRGMKPHSSFGPITFQGVTGISAAKDGTLNYEAGEYSFSFNKQGNNQINLPKKAKALEPGADPKEFFLKLGMSSQMYKMKPAIKTHDYLLTSTKVIKSDKDAIGDQVIETYSVAVKFEYSKTDPNKKEDVEASDPSSDESDAD